MKKGYHIWPYDSKPHPVGKTHKKQPMAYDNINTLIRENNGNLQK